MKKIIVLILISIFYLHAQSIDIGTGAELNIGTGADVCAGSPSNFTGTITGTGTRCTIPLPVELSSFTANVNGRTVTLQWFTKSEINSAGFVIEKKLNEQWFGLAEIKAAGNSNVPKAYFYIDNDVKSGIASYRLKMIDLDGKFEYSSVAAAQVTTPEDFMLAQNFPNPFNPSTVIEYQLPYQCSVNLSVYDVTGKLIKEIVKGVQLSGYYKESFGADNLSSGIYFLRLNALHDGGKFTSIKKMILMR